jgi:thiol-disulfide isomerase/thioredoxin
MVKKNSFASDIFIVVLILFSFYSINTNAIGGGHEIKVHIKDLKDSTIYLGNHFGDKQYINDTVKLDQNGWGTFKGEDTLTGGIYLIITPRKTYFEIIVSEQKFTIEADTTDFIRSFKSSGSLENKLFNEHQKFIVKKGEETQFLRAKIDAGMYKDSIPFWRKQIQEMDADVKKYRLNLVKEYPNTFMAKIIYTMQEPEIPEPPRDDKGNITDSSFQFRYYKKHFLDNVDFSDERLLRTPIFHGKIKTYIEKLTVPIPDSLIVSIDTVIERSRANKEVFKYCVATLANQYETSKIMGYDKIFVHIAEKYYLTDDAFWADSTLKAKIHERVDKIKPNILGTPAHDLAMYDTSLKVKTLYSVKAKYTILTFWDPTCSHCKVEIPKLARYYDSLKTSVSIEVYSVGIESDIEVWKKFIRDNNLNWINVIDAYNNTNFRNYYDIYSTPVIYLLDDQKRILAKRLDTDKLKDFIEHSEKADKEKK